MQQFSSTSEPGARRSPPSRSSPAGYGFLGTGEITAAIVEGLSSDVADPPAVYLSPRGRDVGRELAGRFPNVRVCSSNQEVLDNATAVHMKPGGINEQFMTDLRRDGMPDMVRSALDHVLARLRA